MFGFDEQRNFPNVAHADWRAGGYYARRIPGGRLLAIVLNTNALALGGGQRQLDWLSDRLSKARAHRLRVMLFGHIPPGPSHFEFDSICLRGHYYARAGGASWRPPAQRRLLELIREYSDLMPASFWGHHHTESIRLIPRDPQDPTAREALAPEVLVPHVMFLSPSLTPRNPPHSPAVRLVHFERPSGHVLNVTDFSFDLPSANARGEATWTAASPLNELELRSLNATEWQRVLRGMLFSDEPHSQRELNAEDPFLRMYAPQRCAQQVYIESGPPSLPPLRRCKLAVLCAMLYLEDEPYARCLSGTSLGAHKFEQTLK